MENQPTDTSQDTVTTALSPDVMPIPELTPLQKEAISVQCAIESHCESHARDAWWEFQLRHGLTDEETDNYANGAM